MYFIQCQTCGSTRTVQAIRTGFVAQVSKRRKRVLKVAGNSDSEDEGEIQVTAETIESTSPITGKKRRNPGTSSSPVTKKRKLSKK